MLKLENLQIYDQIRPIIFRCSKLHMERIKNDFSRAVQFFFTDAFKLALSWNFHTLKPLHG